MMNMRRNFEVSEHAADASWFVPPSHGHNNAE